MNQKYKFAIVFLAVGLLVGSFITYSFSQGSTTFTITSGIYPGAPSYTVWKEGSTYYAKNSYGSIAYSGTNATTIIQSCLDTFSSGGSLLISEGDYDVDGLEVTDSDVTIEGEGYLSHLTMTGNNNTMIYVHGTSLSDRVERVVIKNLFLEGNHPAPFGDVARGIQFANAWKSMIHNVHIYGTYGDGILLGANCSVMTVSDVQIIDVSGNGIELDGTQDSVISNIKVYGSLGSGLYGAACARNQITGSAFDTNYRWGVQFYDSSQNSISSCLIYDNDFGNTATYDGIECGGNSDNNTITGCMLNNNDRYDLVLVSTADYNTVIGCSALSTDCLTWIKDLGTTNEIHSCFNGTSWVT